MTMTVAGERGQRSSSPTAGRRDAGTLMDNGHRRRFRRGDALFHEGQRCVGVMLVVSGLVKLSQNMLDGTESIVAIVGPGELLGELSALDARPHAMTARAVEPVEVIVSAADAFVEFALSDAERARTLLSHLSARLRDADDKQIEFGTTDTRVRLARRLLELSRRFGKDDGTATSIPVKLSQEELAAWTGASRDAVVKALRALRARGWIETRRREVRVTDPIALTAYATS